MTLSEAADISIIAGILVAILTYITNSFFQFRDKRIENLSRYLDAHEQLFKPESFLIAVIKDLENGTYKRDENDKDMETKFNRFLGDVEDLALLTSHNAVPITIQVYMFGWFAQKIQPHITTDERNNIFWELAVHYIDELKKAADDYAKLPNEKREKYLKKNSLEYKKYS